MVIELCNVEKNDYINICQCKLVQEKIFLMMMDNN